MANNKSNSPGRKTILFIVVVSFWMAISIIFSVPGLIINIFLILAAIGILVSAGFRQKMWGIAGKIPPEKTPIKIGVSLLLVALMSSILAGAILGQEETTKSTKPMVVSKRTPTQVAKAVPAVNNRDGQQENEGKKGEITLSDQLACAKTELGESERLLNNDDPESQINIQRALTCARRAVQLDPDSDEAANLISKAEDIHKTIERKIVPSTKEFKIFRALWDQLNGNPDVDEDVIVRRVAKKFRTSKSDVSKVQIKVQVYKEWAGKQLKPLLRAAIHTKSSVESIIYEPSQDSVVVKLAAKVGWTESSMQKVIKSDLIKAVGAIFEVSPMIRKADVWIVAPMEGGDFQKVASVEVSRDHHDRLGGLYFKNANPDDVGRLNPWLGPSMR